MANTFELIASSTVGAGGASSITFTGIASTWTDLQILISGRITGYSSAVYDYVGMTFNGDTTASYDNKVLAGNGSTASSFDVSGATSIRQTITMPSDTATSNTFGNASWYIPKYAGSSYKSVSADGVSENNGTTTFQTLGAGIWNKTNAITSINIFPLQGTAFAQYTTAYLYGVKNA